MIQSENKPHKHISSLGIDLVTSKFNENFVESKDMS